MCKNVMFWFNMLRLFCFNTKNLEKLLNNEFQYCWTSNFFSNNLTHKPNIFYSPAYAINYFNTCQGFLKHHIENIENFNPSKMVIKKDGAVKKKKKPVGVKVYLLNEKGISSSLFLQDAEKLAQRQGLKLKKIEDINGITAYKLVPISELLETECSSIKDKEIKEVKVKKLIINEDINPHDLKIKINHISKFLDKGMKVFIKLGDSSSDFSKLNAIYGELEKSLAVHHISKFASKSGIHINIWSKQKHTNDRKI